MRIGLYKLTSCVGCTLEFLSALSRSPGTLRELEVFSPLFSDSYYAGSYDVVFLEGSVSEPEHEELIEELRGKSKLLIAIGTCALHGGLQNVSLENNKPVSSVVKVDYALPGCPVNSDALANLLNKLLLGGLDINISEPLCLECKRKNVTCLLVLRSTPCMGPITRSGCGAICPSAGRGCIGCYGFREDLSERELRAFVDKLVEMGYSREAIEKYAITYRGRR